MQPDDAADPSPVLEVDCAHLVPTVQTGIRHLWIFAGCCSPLLLIPALVGTDPNLPNSDISALGIFLLQAWWLWVIVAIAGVVAFGRFLTWYEVRAIELVEAPGGALFTADDQSLRIPHLMVYARPFLRPRDADKSHLTIPWSEIHKVHIAGRPGKAKAFALSLGPDGAILISPRIFINRRAFTPAEKRRFVEMARLYAKDGVRGDLGKF